MPRVKKPPLFLGNNNVLTTDQTQIPKSGGKIISLFHPHHTDNFGSFESEDSSDEGVSEVSEPYSVYDEDGHEEAIHQTTVCLTNEEAKRCFSSPPVDEIRDRWQIVWQLFATKCRT